MHTRLGRSKFRLRNSLRKRSDRPSQRRMCVSRFEGSGSPHGSIIMKFLAL